ncbi:MAG TPA: hypothetical protein VGF69_18150 [Thermoanaerobaculia bacterium]|jgi:hypothetical protein
MKIATTVLALFVSLPFTGPAAAQSRPFHLQLEANPSAPFPWLGKFGSVDLHVYQGGVRAEALWLNAFSANRAKFVTVENPLGRAYVELPVVEIAPTLAKLAGKNAGVERAAVATLAKPLHGKVGGVDATRYRLMYGPQAWVDVWTTAAIPENPQLRALVQEFVRGVSPASAELSKKIPGTPLYVELNFRRFKKVPVLTLKSLTFEAGDEAEALKLGALYFRAPILDALLKR